MAAEREREAATRRAAQGDHQDGERPPEEFLNETAYDRRKQVALLSLVLCARDRARQCSAGFQGCTLTMATNICRWLCTSGTGRELIISQTVRSYLNLNTHVAREPTGCSWASCSKPKPVMPSADIPPEELVSFMAKSGKEEAVQAAGEQHKISGSNIGHKLLSKMGWKVCCNLWGPRATYALPCVPEGRYSNGVSIAGTACNRKAKVWEQVVRGLLRQ